MPGFVLEEAFPLARFNKKIDEKNCRLFTVGLNALESVLGGNQATDRSDIADHVAVTLQGEGFKIYNTTDQKCTQSWIAPPGVAFAGSATHKDGGSDADSIDYTYAIIASSPELQKEKELKTVWLWKNAKNSENDSGDHITKTFEERIQSIHLSSALPSHVMLISENGSIELHTKDFERLFAKYKAQKNARVVWSTVFVTSNAQCCIPSSVSPTGSTIVVTVLQSGDNYTVKLDCVNVERRSIDHMTSTEMKLSEKPIAFTLDPNDGRFTVLGANGTWSVWSMQLKYSSSKKLASQFVQDLSIPLKGYRFRDEVLGNVASIAPLGDSYVAMIAPRIKNKQEEHVVSVWDVKYGTLQAEQVVKTSEKTQFNKNCVYSIAALPNSHLAITISSIDVQNSKKSGKTRQKVVDTNSLVMLCPYYSEPVSLMAAMGKMKQTVAFMGINEDFNSSENIGFSRSGHESVGHDIGFSNELKDAEVAYNTWVSKIEENRDVESNVLAELFKKDTTDKQRIRVFFNHVQAESPIVEDVTTESLEAQIEQYQGWLQTRYKREAKRDVDLSQFFISTIITRYFSATETTQWPLDILLYMLSRNIVRSNFCEKGIVRTLLERDEWALLWIVLERVKDVSEGEFVALVKALIVKRNEKSEEWSGERFNRYFKAVIDAPTNEVFLQQALNRISATELPVIIHTLTEWLEEKSSDSFHRIKIINFCNCILDVHFPTLILEPSLHPVVNTLMGLISKEMRIANELSQLKNILGAYSRKQRHTHAKKAANKQLKNAAGSRDELTRLRKKKNGKFGGEQGIPVYRIEVFKF